MTGRQYVRFAALGDSTTVGIGDGCRNAWRGWARLLSDALAGTHDVSFCNVAVSGATTSLVRSDQLGDALSHQPTLASLVVGVNDTMRGSWDPLQTRRDLVHCADVLAGQGARLLTVRFHDHGAVLRLPGPLRRGLFHRIQAVNDAIDEVHARHGSLQVDLAAVPRLADREFWSIDRLHPSELGHRTLAREFGRLLQQAGMDLELPSVELDRFHQPTWRSDLHWMVTEGAPWIGRRARDLGPVAVRAALHRPAPQPVG